MSWIDKIPTIGEVIDYVACRLTDHEWMDLKFQDGTQVRICKDCGKIEEKKIG